MQSQADGIANEGPAFDNWGRLVTTFLHTLHAYKPSCTGKRNTGRVYPEKHHIADQRVTKAWCWA